MDTRRLDTGQVLAAGIINRPLPKTDVPTDREVVDVDIYSDQITEASVSALLDSGVVVDCAEYYGIPTAWKTEDGYRAILLQYRAVTEDHTFATVEEAAEWFIETANAVAG